MPYCPGCGKEIEGGVKFCPECGAGIVPAAPPAKPAPPEEKPAPAPPPEPRGRGKLIAGVVVVVLVVVGVVAAVLLTGRVTTISSLEMKMDITAPEVRTATAIFQVKNIGSSNLKIRLGELGGSSYYISDFGLMKAFLYYNGRWYEASIPSPPPNISIGDFKAGDAVALAFALARATPVYAVPIGVEPSGVGPYFIDNDVWEKFEICRKAFAGWTGGEHTFTLTVGTTTGTIRFHDVVINPDLPDSLFQPS